MTDHECGHHFHEALFALMPQAAHAEDPDHHRAVGQALRIALEDHDPERATADYNAWAVTHGYVPVVWLGTLADGSFIADIQEAVIAVAPDGRLTLLETRI